MSVHNERKHDRRRIWKRIGLSTTSTVVLVLLLIAIWGVVVEPRFLLDVRNETAEVRNLPESWDGETIVLLADFQVGMWLDNDGMVRKAVRKAIDLDPGAVLIAGDFIYGEAPNRVDRAVELVRPLADAGVPAFAVLGNHDFSMMKHDSDKRARVAADLKARLVKAGIQVLENESRPVLPRNGNAPLHIVGLGSYWAGQSDPSAAISTLAPEAPRIVLMHNPVAFRNLPAHSASLALSAHTHGGQLRIPFTRSKSWVDVAREREVIADGWGEQGIGETGNRIYVNRGIGFSMIPARFNCRPELTVFTLKLANGRVPGRGPEGDNGDDPGTPDRDESGS